MVHTGELAERLWADLTLTFADMLWQDLSNQSPRRIPSNGEHSIA